MLNGTALWRTGEHLESPTTRDQATQFNNRPESVSVGVGADLPPFVPPADLLPVPVEPAPALPLLPPPDRSVPNVATVSSQSKVLPRARRTGAISVEPLMGSMTSNKPGPSRTSLSFSSGKENIPPSPKVEIKSESKPSVRSRLEVRKARRLGLNSKSMPPIIDLTEDDDVVDAKPDLILSSDSKSVKTDLSLPTSSNSKPLGISDGTTPEPVPWKLGPVPHILLSSKTLDGEVMDTFDKLKSKVASKLQSQSSSSTSIPPCPPLPLMSSPAKVPQTRSKSKAATVTFSSSLKQVSFDPTKPSSSVSADSRPGPSGVTSAQKSVLQSLALSESDDETPLDQLIPSRKSLRKYSVAPVTPSAKSSPVNPNTASTGSSPDLTQRKKSRRKRPYTSE